MENAKTKWATQTTTFSMEQMEQMSHRDPISVPGADLPHKC